MYAHVLHNPGEAYRNREMFTFACGGVVEYHASQNATPTTDLHFYSRDALPDVYGSNISALTNKLKCFCHISCVKFMIIFFYSPVSDMPHFKISELSFHIR